MSNRRWFKVGLAAVACLLVACAAPPTEQRSSGRDVGAATPASLAPTRLVAAIMAEPDSLNRAFLTGGATIQVADISDTLVNIGLTVVDSSNARRPALAEAVPSLENGLWKLLLDGGMEVAWKLRPGTTWHDGTPFTVEDLPVG